MRRDRLYRLDAWKLEDDICFRKNYEMLSPARREKIDAYRFQIGRAHV